MSDSIAVFSASIFSAIAMGLSCGTGCSPAISTLLSSYVFHLKGDIKKSLKAFLAFFVGKACAILVVCLIASVVGSVFIDSDGYFGKYKLTILMPLFLIITGVYMLRKIYDEYKSQGCASCNHCSKEKHLQMTSPLIGGFLYGLTPCAPLVLLAGYAITLPLIYALILGVIFSISSTFSPLILMLVFMKLMATKMLQEVPELFKFIRVVMSLAVIIIGTMSIL